MSNSPPVFPAPESLTEDSTDFTAEEARTALATSCTKDISDWIRITTCPQCSKQVRVVAHEFRRRALKLYWRVQMVCVSDHPSAKVFKADWLKGQGSLVEG